MLASIITLAVISLIVWMLYRMSPAENKEIESKEQKLQKMWVGEYEEKPMEDRTMHGEPLQVRAHKNDQKQNHTQAAIRAIDSSWRSAPSARAAQERGSRAAMAKGRGWDYETKVDQHGHWWRLVASKGEVELSQPAGSKEQRSQLTSRLRLTAPIWPRFDLTVQDGQYFMCSWVPFSHDGKQYARFCMESSDKLVTEKDTELMYSKLCSAASATTRFAKPTADDRVISNDNNNKQ